MRKKKRLRTTVALFWSANDHPSCKDLMTGGKVSKMNVNHK